MSKEGYYQGEIEYTSFTGKPSVWWDKKSQRWKSVFSQKFVKSEMAEKIIAISDETVESMKNKKYDMIGREVEA